MLSHGHDLTVKRFEKDTFGSFRTFSGDSNWFLISRLITCRTLFLFAKMQTKQTIEVFQMVIAMHNVRHLDFKQAFL